MNKKGFTLPEVMIAFLLISFIVVWSINTIPNLRVKSVEEDYRLIALTRNVDILESTRNELYKTGQIKQFSHSELTGEAFGGGTYYSTSYEKFQSSKDKSSKLYTTLEGILNNPEYPELATLRPSSGSRSELYLVELNTTVGQRRLPTSGLTTFMYRND